ncbi:MULTISPECIES: NADH-quinone oxidoreductase subunit J [Moorena]|uniref:NADH-quinone oxidoreductase subunit J n=1 Tax=Moorena producens 3L TaxID=489825 RepID=F4XSU0_9CYAN|nr:MULTISPECIES: NADH-quinone oxidoreductase subunit J [Moorena]NEQ16115.1 NADH-quinone oxidoreductase subunit J [Moorena sp. SIO3E2]EGJ32345.1 NADH dehydrogenase subunit J [Moorena producens 3L]NEP35234.1 NADH-quinone oxidoreductase subunit J [Moorena sp. SIO3B2]NEP66287.1 NADH-quinone oxidoreductase subunit J [Moorena sp. SIO3A5]NEQ09234.1 NADH-quinone oxidoreductase subunit J [Moorena sp. SIO4E2]
MNLAEGVQIISVAILSVIMIGAALGVVLLSNIVYSAFLLAGVFIGISGLYILLNADFVAAAQILIYVGAVNVLILFAIMLVNKREDFQPMTKRWVRTGSTAIVCIGLFALLSTMVLATPWSVEIDPAMVVTNTAVEIGQHFFSDFLLPFELASVLLLMAMVGAIIIARRDYIPEELVSRDQEIATALTLPERPRELASVAGDSTKTTV